MALNENGPFPLRREDEDDRRCPHCGADLTGGPGLMGVETEYDAISYWVHRPGCGMAWPRWTGGGRRTEDAERHVEIHNRNMTEHLPVARRALVDRGDIVVDVLRSEGFSAPLGWDYWARPGTVVLIVESLDPAADWDAESTRAGAVAEGLRFVVGARVYVKVVLPDGDPGRGGWDPRTRTEALYAADPWPVQEDE